MNFRLGQYVKIKPFDNKIGVVVAIDEYDSIFNYVVLYSQPSSGNPPLLSRFSKYASLPKERYREITKTFNTPNWFSRKSLEPVGILQKEKT